MVKNQENQENLERWNNLENPKEVVKNQENLERWKKVVIAIIKKLYQKKDLLEENKF